MKKNKVGRLARSVAFATLITTLLTCCVVGVFARYTSTMTGTLTMRVAKWDVSVSADANANEKPKFDLIDKDGQKTAAYTFDVTSESEVALSYDVVLTMPKAIPEGLTFTIVTVNGNAVEISPTISTDKKIYTFSNDDILKFTADGGTNSHTLKITTDFSHNSIKLEGIKVEVIAEQTN